MENQAEKKNNNYAQEISKGEQEGYRKFSSQVMEEMKNNNVVLTYPIYWQFASSEKKPDNIPSALNE